MPRNPATSRPTKPTKLPSVPANRKLTKEKVEAAMMALHQKGEAVTIVAVFAYLGKKGSYSTLIRLKKEIEKENPLKFGGLQLKSILEYIAHCDRIHLPAIEKALAPRRRVIRFWKDRLGMECNKDDRELRDSGVLRGAKYDQFDGWSIEATMDNLETLLLNDFTTFREDEIRKEIKRRTKTTGA